MWQDQQSHRLSDEIEAVLNPLNDCAELRNLVYEAATESDRGVVGGWEARRLWSLLPLVVCESVCCRYEPALPVAAAIHLFKSAAEVLDDIEDADEQNSLAFRHGVAIAANVATVLLVLAEKAVALLPGKGVPLGAAVRIVDTINSYYATACVGQQSDLSLSLGAGISEETYLKVARMKSASHIECACVVGALVATGEQDIVGLFSTFGQHLGMAGQIANDIQGVTSGTDVVKRKITLPAIYAMSQTMGPDRTFLEAAFSSGSGLPTEVVQTQEILFRTGAIHYAMVKLELYKQLALEALQEAEIRGYHVERLKLFLE